MSDTTMISKNIPLADLNKCHDRIREELDAAWTRVMDGSKFIYGEEVSKFEDEIGEYLGVDHVVGCGNGTDALIGAIKALEIPEGSEIIAPNFTFIAPIEAVLQAGYKGALVDVDPETYTMDVDKLERLISPNTKAIIAVHINGQCADMESIQELAKKYNLFLIEDAAQGMGAECYFKDGTTRKAGSLADISTTSFFPSKNLGGIGDGGAVFSNDENLMKRVRTYFAHGKSGPNYQQVGVNSRLDGIQAAALRVKLSHLDAFNQRRQESAQRYDSAFANLDLIKTPGKCEHSNHTYHKYSILVKNGLRQALMNFLKDRNISSKVYYAFPCHSEPPYNGVRTIDDELEVSSAISNEVLSIPMHSELSIEDQDRVIEAIQDFVNQQ